MVASRPELEAVLRLSAEELRWFEAQGDALPFLVSRYYLALVDPADPDDPIRRQVVPTQAELAFEPEALGDPLAEVDHSVFPRLIHRYENRVALLVTDFCATYCRHCFRRRFTATSCGVSARMRNWFLKICSIFSMAVPFKPTS